VVKRACWHTDAGLDYRPTIRAALCQANQTLPQRDLFTPFAQGVFDVPAPEQRLALHALLADLDQAVFEARRTARPVHLNLAYRKPFVDEAFTVATLPPEEMEELMQWSARATPYCTYLHPQLC
jgi:2-succinyl-5-enolpyruvyl-6-hydroxy-3-cyclohexene-1-carboxylate synthase